MSTVANAPASATTSHSGSRFCCYSSGNSSTKSRSTLRSRLQPQTQPGASITESREASHTAKTPGAIPLTSPHHHTYATLPARLPSVSEVQAAQSLSLSRSSSCRLPSRATSLRRQKSTASAKRRRTGPAVSSDSEARQTSDSLASARPNTQTGFGTGLTVEEAIGLAIALAELEEV